MIWFAVLLSTVFLACFMAGASPNVTIMWLAITGLVVNVAFAVAPRGRR